MKSLAELVSTETKEGSLEASTRAAVPVQEAFDLKIDIARQLGMSGA